MEAFSVLIKFLPRTNKLLLLNQFILDDEFYFAMSLARTSYYFLAFIGRFS